MSRSKYGKRPPPKVPPKWPRNSFPPPMSRPSEVDAATMLPRSEPPPVRPLPPDIRGRERDIRWQFERATGAEAVKWGAMLRKLERESGSKRARKLPAALDFSAGHWLSDADAARLAAHGDPGLTRIWELCGQAVTAATVYGLVGVHSKVATGRKADAYADGAADAWAALRAWDPAQGRGALRPYLTACVRQGYCKRQRDDCGGMKFRSAKDAPEEARGDHGDTDPRAHGRPGRQSYLSSDAPPPGNFEGERPEFLDFLLREGAADPFDAAWREFARDHREAIEENLPQAVGRMKAGKPKVAVRALLLPAAGPEYERTDKATAPLLREFAERQGVDPKTVKNWLAEGVAVLRQDADIRALERAWRDYRPRPAPYCATRW